MGNVYVLQNDGGTVPMNRIWCKDEDRELQQILEKNPDLLPGDQINPDDPRSWLLIKREMPVQDPSTGSDRWSVDFFFVDQDAVPTFVECKRFHDTRARREVVGQVLEYAANGHYYWTRDTIRGFAAKSAQDKGTTLEEALRTLRGDDDNDVEAFLEQVEGNLREGQVRIVFFLEDSPFELRSVVDFLNKQMERSEVLLVEARQYEREGLKVVVPVLFGYTEEARMVKKPPRPPPPGRRKWDEVSFFEELRANVDGGSVEAVRRLYDHCESLGCVMSWGTAKRRGSFNVKCLSMCPRSFLTICTDGQLRFNFGWLTESEQAEQLREQLKPVASDVVGISLPDDFRDRWITCPIGMWAGKVELLIGKLNEILPKPIVEPA